MQRLSPSEIPFSTTDAILAYCLYSVGVPFHNPRAPLRNEYDADILKNLGYRGEVSLLEIAKDALSKGKRGRIRYIFKQTKDLPKLLKIFNAQKAEVDKPGSEIDASQWQMDLMEKVAKGKVNPREALLRLTCVSVKTNTLFRNIFKELPGIVVIPNQGETRHFNTTVTVQTKQGAQTVPARGVESPGFIQVPTNASDKVLRKLKLI